MMKRILAILCVLAILISLAACTTTPNAPSAGDTQTGDGGKLFEEPVEINLLIGSHPSWPYRDDFEIWKLFRERTGANLKVAAIPNTELHTKIALLMATPDDLPDMMHMTYKYVVDQYATQGAFVAIDDYLDMMPNYTSFWQSVPQQERDALLVQRLSADGKTYFPQVYGNERANNLQTWMYRKDIFEKNNLSVPTTLDELHDVCVKLKELYPTSYPFCMRDGIGRLEMLGPQFKPYFSLTSYYDFTDDTWKYGALEPTMREMTEFLIKMRTEGLLPPDFLTISSKSWEELVSTDRGFIMEEYTVRFDFFNPPNRLRDPDYTWSIMAPPKANTPTGQNLIAKFNFDSTGYAICNTGDKQGIENSIKLLDWMYSDEGSELLSWGEEGVTYEIEDNKKKFIVDEGERPAVKYGMHSYGTYQRVDPDAIMTAYTDETAEMINIAQNYIEENVNPIQWVALSDDEQAVIKDVSATVESFFHEELSKFISGQRSMSEWDSFVEEMKNMRIDKILNIYETAYARALGK